VEKAVRGRDRERKKEELEDRGGVLMEREG
jgi:hypothetical protein